jgi:SAM-dependent methyltransferase
MRHSAKEFEDYFSRLQKISFAGRAYKRLFLSPVLYLCARRFGNRTIEIGSGTGSGVLGTFPKRVQGLEINPVAVEYCRAAGLNVHLIGDDGAFPVADGAFDACVLDNVLEHIDDPRRTLDECYRITSEDGGLIVAVPGVRGHESDSDHKKFYDEKALRALDDRWSLQSLFSTPFFFVLETLSRSVRQYCLVAIYKKVQRGPNIMNSAPARG